MAVKVFNNRATFLLKADDGTKMYLKPLGFADVPDKFTGDPTFKMGVKAGVIQTFEQSKEGTEIERKAHEPKRREKSSADGDSKQKPENVPKE